MSWTIHAASPSLIASKNSITARYWKLNYIKLATIIVYPNSNSRILARRLLRRMLLRHNSRCCGAASPIVAVWYHQPLPRSRSPYTRSQDRVLTPQQRTRRLLWATATWWHASEIAIRARFVFTLARLYFANGFADCAGQITFNIVESKYSQMKNAFSIIFNARCLSRDSSKA